ncbi:hypothetical protein EJ04DRAFT_87882 [Polyplosphaeria fusca]|uniref:Nephrocystin 3-like N-terminal domain-containing protein n=1 Tax=Polyplosphaeria fusca TaxID=682080 RepID=A0A9P4QNC6_9PLEO|nr:hypothetical protein EJ04DRAFT_87882 [Polyplosphaeria fusca]
MNARSSQVAEAHQDTFKWIFGEKARIGGNNSSTDVLNSDIFYADDYDTARWDDFVGWLQDDRPIYWINGKPGSGKSTLMRFLIHYGRTREILEHRNPSMKISATFIWAAGSPMQRSLKGLLCALLHALILRATPSFIQAWLRT